MNHKLPVLVCLLCCVAILVAGEAVHTYDYTGYIGSDTNKTVMVKGVIALQVSETNKVTGFWTLKAQGIYSPKVLGRQDGDGKIVGRMEGDTVFLNLNPDYHENNVFLDGKVTEAGLARITGRWGYYGFAGKASEGDFEMVSKDPPPTPPTNGVSRQAESPVAKPPPNKPGP